MVNYRKMVKAMKLLWLVVLAAFLVPSAAAEETTGTNNGGRCELDDPTCIVHCILALDCDSKCVSFGETGNGGGPGDVGANHPNPLTGDDGWTGLYDCEANEDFPDDGEPSEDPNG